MSKWMATGGGKNRATQQSSEARNLQEQAVAMATQAQNAAVADTEKSVGRARRTPRGRRQLIGNENTRLG
jgi:hypothetical protein